MIFTRARVSLALLFYYPWGKLGTTRNLSSGLTTSKNFSYLQNRNEVGISSTPCGYIGYGRTYWVVLQSTGSESEKELIHWVGYQNASQSAVVEFRSSLKQSAPPKYYNPQPSSDVYWKIGLSLTDADTARLKLIRRGVEVTSPRQFRDIGYMCHLSDPFGFSLELLQHDFQSNFSSERVQASLEPNLALGQRALIGQITLRVSDINRSLQFYQSTLGMKLLFIQSIPNMFNLYFLACTDEKPPSDDVNAVEIREWLWKRPYTTLELICIIISGRTGSTTQQTWTMKVALLRSRL